MDLFSVKVRHAGNRNMEIARDEATPAEIVLLRIIHGAESVHSVVKVRTGSKSHAKERERLSAAYGAKVFAAAFPGSAPRLPLTLAEAGLRDDGTAIDNGVDPEDEEDDAPAPPPSEAAKAIAAKVLAARAAKPAGETLT